MGVKRSEEGASKLVLFGPSNLAGIGDGGVVESTSIGGLQWTLTEFWQTVAEGRADNRERDGERSS